MRNITSILILAIFFNSCDSYKESKSKSDLKNINNATETAKNMTEPIDTILYLPDSKDVLVLRTDFSSDDKWESICDMISNSGKELGFRPYVEYLSRRKFERIKNERLLKRNDNYKHLFIFLVDSITMIHDEYPILCIDLYDKPGDSFRVIPSEIWGVENNLSISNMDFEEFINTTDKDGIHRGFKK